MILEQVDAFTPKAKSLIKQTALSETGPDGEVSLFGISVDDKRRSGDINLYIERAGELQLLQRVRIKMQLEEALDVPVDVVVWRMGTTATPFQRIAAHELLPFLYQTIRRLVAHCDDNLTISPANFDFSKHFERSTRTA